MYLEIVICKNGLKLAGPQLFDHDACHQEVAVGMIFAAVGSMRCFIDWIEDHTGAVDIVHIENST